MTSEGQIAEVLAAHAYEPQDSDIWGCTCGWYAERQEYDPDEHRAHVAVILADLVHRERVAVLWETIEAHEVTFGIACTTSREWLRDHTDGIEAGR